MRRWLWLGILLAWFAWPQQMVHAAISDLSVSPVTTRQPSDRFEVSGSAGSKQTLTLSVANFGYAAKQIVIKPLNAMTTASGTLGYSASRPLAAATSVTQLVKSQTLTLLPQTSKEVAIPITLPAIAFDGEVLGAIAVQIDQSLLPEDRGQITVPVAITMTDRLPEFNPTVGTPISSMDKQHPWLTIPVENRQARTMRHVKVTLKVQEQHWWNRFVAPTVQQVTMTNVTIAPNSVLPLKVKAPGNRFESSYQVSGTIQAGSQTWPIKQVLHPNAEAIADFNRDLPWPWTIWATLIGVFLGIVVLVAVIRYWWLFRK
ncbi:WxL protein peptidoglycan domain-containing protein [Lacticaseibacillus saniviri]|uniref:WxL protein peptidoglycan domain-containing protein n=1 Tax=Lacticaseibacillus saniviri TaxID=931533 RepID=UPI0006D2C556|nr:DUF916 domain-containing protein [Lacticaseibacillus saniviri]MCG4281716.1 DUF916 and DUF3324 domain-containing protein [Lacticaseibacillus saniviri]